MYSSKSGKSAKSGKSSKIRIKKRKKLAELSSCLQMTLLAHHIHFTKEVEACYTNAITTSSSSSRNTASTTTTAATVVAALETLCDSTLQHISAWSDTCHDSNVDAHQYAVLVSTAQIAQALHFRDIVSSLIAQISTSNSSSIDDVHSDFRWTQHLRYYYNGMSNSGSGDNTNTTTAADASGNRKVSEIARSNSTLTTSVKAAQPLLPCISARVGPWTVSYGWSYYGTNERLWVAPLAEKCLYHMIHSARKGGGGLLTTTSCSSTDNATLTNGSLDAQTASIQAWDTAIAFGRGVHVLQGSLLTSPQAVSTLLKRVLCSGDVCVLCSVDSLSSLTRAVLAESLQVICNAVRTGSKKVCMNGTDIALAQVYPHAADDYDVLLHQWKLPGAIHQSTADAVDDTTTAATQYDNHDFTLPFFTTLATCTLSGKPRCNSSSSRVSSDGALPLNLRLSSRPVSVISPSISVLLPSMLFTSGFRFAPQLSVALLQGLSNVFELDREGHLAKLLQFTSDNSNQSSAQQQQQQQLLCTIDKVTLHRVLLNKAIRLAATVVARERGRNFSLADKKLGISTLPKAEKQRNIEQLFLATEGKVLVSGVLKAILDVIQSQTVLGYKAATSVAAVAVVVTEASTTALANTVANVLLQSFTAIMQPLRDLTAIVGKRSQLPSQMQAAKQQQAAAAKQSLNISDELLQLFTGDGSGKVSLSRDEQAVLVLMKSALVVQGMQPSASQVKAAVAIWDSLWTTRHSAVIVCGHTGIGKCMK
jgi:hypothetical protein